MPTNPADRLAAPTFQRYEDHDTGAPMYQAEEVDPVIQGLLAELRTLQQRVKELEQDFSFEAAVGYLKRIKSLHQQLQEARELYEANHG